MNGLRARLMFTFLLLIIISLGLFIARVGSLLSASRFAETQRDQEGRVILISSATEELLEKLRAGQLDFVGLEQAVNALAAEINQPIVVLDSQGRTLVDQAHPQIGEPRDAKQPEVLAALQGNISRDIRFDPDGQVSALYTAAPIRHDQDLLGVVRIKLAMSTIDATNRMMWFTLVGAGSLAALGTILISLWFAQSLVKPIRELTQGATALAEGDLRTRIRIRAAKELEQLAAAFNFMADRLSRVMEDQRAFVADAAHELRTPLTTIRLRAEALREGANDNPQVAVKFLEDIESETDRLSRLVDQLIDLSRIETGLIEPRREPVSMPEIAQGVAAGMEERARQQQVTVQVENAVQTPRISADPDQMRQIFFNLIGNAVKFTPVGGTVRVNWTIEKRANELVTTVRDTGIGIGAGDLPHIFDRFYRADKARARATGGAGLGLAIVKSIIDAHGGRVWAESEKDKGTAIIFALPIA